MLRRAPTTTDGKVVNRLQESTRVNKPFRPPSFTTDRVQPHRKRKRVSYKGQQGEASDDDDDGPSKKKKKKDDKDYMTEEELLAAVKQYPVFKPKPFQQLRRFSMPSMRNKEGKDIILTSARPNGGSRYCALRPTIDDRETEEEKMEREKNEAKERAMKEAEEKTAGMFNPHKNLRALLGEGKDKKDNVSKVPVVIDPRLSKVLRPHQVEGVKFLYKCTTGMMVDNQYGCIMADEMGLGKTLQCIALMWTLIKQSPHAGKPSIEKCIIACPSKTVKWLGADAINALAVDGKGGKGELLTRVAHDDSFLRNAPDTDRISDQLQDWLLLCDEGHRLKNSDSLTFQALNSLDVKRRVILTGTPIQNDLSEYFSLLNFANPNYLGSKNAFKKNFENLIIRGRDASASDAVKAESEKKLKELGGLVTKFIIRRTNDLLSKYRESIVLPSVYEGLIPRRSPCQKLCNHPELLNLPDDLKGSDHLIPEGFCGAGQAASARGRNNQTVRCDWGGKFLVLERFLHQLRTQTNDKIVLISNYTQTLDLFEKLCRNKKYGFFRLDGALSITKRQKLVDQFNNPEGKEFIFLLSSKAGGCGINLIGANRLILFDPDWNPAADQQALARVWRDGQKKECFVYRFISTGTIEEKIFQRQANKQALSSAVVDEKEDTERHFTLDALRQLFLFNENTLCETHETFKCKRCKNGRQMIKAPALLYGDASTWNHFTNEELANNHDDLLRAEVGFPEVSFVFQYISH
ncbi:hypothetical protein D9757_013422 [Collybiopsis confluens]|uniref:Uncharacterized protein n=1 Tax=Collybiopsis confluens TaxID=2823264 RepID=A0A8H5CTT4_9AGAR|nr:hypothetical protein D9757_013422 [Collybiopsis confluens]